jgi:nucleoid-associated protein EbfC
MVKGLGGLMKQFQEMQARMAQVQAELETLRVTGTSGGGMVEAVMNGKQELLGIKIDKQVIDPQDPEMLEELVLAAVSQAREKATEVQQEKLSAVTGGLPLPGMGGGFPFS